MRSCELGFRRLVESFLMAQAFWNLLTLSASSISYSLLTQPIWSAFAGILKIQTWIWDLIDIHGNTYQTYSLFFLNLQTGHFWITVLLYIFFLQNKLLSFYSQNILSFLQWYFTPYPPVVLKLLEPSCLFSSKDCWELYVCVGVEIGGCAVQTSWRLWTMFKETILWGKT